MTKAHLKELVLNHSKDKHCLTMGDVDVKDKMKFGPTLKIMKPETIEFLKANVTESDGTVLFLNIMRQMYRSFVEEDVSPLERVHDVW